MPLVGHCLPTLAPVFGADRIRETNPDYISILPWNLRGEVAGQMAFVRAWGGQFIILLPKPEIIF